MAHVGTEPAGTGQPDERVQVRAVDVHLATGVVHRSAELGHLRLEHPVGGGIGDHHGGEPVAVFGDLRSNVGQVDVAPVVACDHDDVEASHHRTGRVGAVRTLGDQADAALVVAVGTVIGPDREQSGELALAPSVRLQTHRGVPRDRRETVLELGDQLSVAGRLIGRCKRVEVGEFGPGDRQHLAGGVELHGARAERNHRPVERQVLVAEPAQVAEHLVFGVVPLEHRLREEVVTAPQVRAESVGRLVPTVGTEWSSTEGGDDRLDGGQRARFVEGDADRGVVDPADVEPRCERRTRRACPRRRPGVSARACRTRCRCEPSARRHADRQRRST